MTKDKEIIYELFRLREKLKYIPKSEESRLKSDLANELRCPYCHHKNIRPKRLGDPCICYNCGHLIF